MPRTQFVSLVALLLTAAVLSGCVTSPAPTWTNRGTVDFATIKGRIVCFTDANIIDGQRMEGTICATPVSGFLSDGEPEIYFSPSDFKFMKELASNTTAGITRDFRGKKVFLQCDPILGPDKKAEIGRACKVTVNEQHLVKANVIFRK